MTHTQFHVDDWTKYDADDEADYVDDDDDYVVDYDYDDDDKDYQWR